MRPAFQTIRVLVLSALWLGTASAQLVPPPQDYFLHVWQWPNLDEGLDQRLLVGNHELAWLEAPGAPVVSNALTVEAWVFWEGSDLEELQAATGFDMDQMTLFCGQRAYGFQYRSDDPSAPDGWTFFLQTDTETVPDTGLIALPLREWAHLAATYDGATIRTYVNGVQQTETAASGSIMSLGDAFPHCGYSFESGPPSEVFGIGLGKGYTGGVRQLRIWDHALTEAEILANAGLHLDGTESGLLGYWPLNGPPDPTGAPNEVAGGAPLIFGWNDVRATWRLTDPMFVVREDLAEDALVVDCPSLGPFTLSVVDIHDDGDPDVIFSGATAAVEGDILFPFHAMVHGGVNGFVFDTPGAIAGIVPLARVSMQTVTADFNADGRLDVFSANTGEDFNTTVGAPNTLLLSRPDGRLEDASGNLLGPPCNADTPAFSGQHMCFAGGGGWGRTPGIRYPGTGEAVPPDPAFTHSAAVGDTDGDGDIDILVGNVPHHNLEQPYMLLNDGQGGFLANWQLLPDFLYGDGGEEYDPVSPDGFLLHDMDDDGYVDLVTDPLRRQFSNEWAGGISWNDSSGDYSSAERTSISPTEGIPPNSDNPAPTSGTVPVAADIDLDGDQDLLLVWASIDGADAQSKTSLQILINKGGRVFADETVVRAGAPPQANMPWAEVKEFYARDINSDGCPDILFLRDFFRETDAGIWFNDCHGNFTPVTEPELSKPDSLYVPLDFEGDGDIDLLSANSRPLGLAGTQGCSPGEGAGSDYIDFAVLLNQSPPDTDVDGVSDIHDLFPNDPNEWHDNDNDGTGNNADDDDDNDLVPDKWERDNGLDVFDAADANLDGDGDSLTNINEFLAGTDPRNPDTDGDAVPDGSDNFPLGFSDVPDGAFAFSFIERLALSGITVGCGNGRYCPSAPVTRAQMAVFLERGMNGSNFVPPAASGTVFNDVGAGDFAANFIEQLFSDGITAGCGNNNYCPNSDVTRDQMAVFLLRAKHGSGYSPPAAAGIFGDVPLSFWAVHWIEQLATEGITSGCGGGNYCPAAQVTRDQMAVFLVRTFGL